MSMRDLYEFLLKYYVQRAAWISEIASALNITPKEARFLTQALGCHRGKATAIVSFATFSIDKDVILIQAKLAM